jgi:hypothetical protein
MNKRKLHHLWTRLRLVKPWYFLILGVFFALICLVSLRANNQQMVKLREAVYAADKNGGDVQSALRELQSYVTSHMNTDLSTTNGVYPPIQLKYTYERLSKAAGDKDNNDIYTDAQRHCERSNPNGFFGGGRIPCIQAYVKSHQVDKPEPIPDALYKFAFVSPRWSPDLAGWSMLLAILSFLGFVVSLVTRKWFKRNVA